MIKKIISGGQTGADRGGLDAALELGLEIGGFCPKGLRAEDGRIPDRYPLVELGTGDYRVRTKRNIEASDLTIIFHDGVITPGSIYTGRTAKRLGRSFVIIDLNHAPKTLALRIRQALEFSDVQTLNVAGSRESRAPGIQERVRKILVEALR